MDKQYSEPEMNVVDVVEEDVVCASLPDTGKDMG